MSYDLRNWRVMDAEARIAALLHPRGNFLPTLANVLPDGRVVLAGYVGLKKVERGVVVRLGPAEMSVAEKAMEKCGWKKVESE